MKKFFLVVAVILVVAIIAGVIYVYTNKDKLMGFAIDQTFVAMEGAMAAAVPDSAMQDSVKTLLLKAKTGLKDSTIDQQHFQNIIVYFQQAYKDKALDSTEVAGIMTKLNSIITPQPQE